MPTWREFGKRLAHYPLASLITGLSFTYDVAANYKVLAENYNECYHCGPVHPELSRLVPSFGRRRAATWTGRTASRIARGPGPSRCPAPPTGGRFPDLDEPERTRHKGELVYPNLWLSASADHVAAFVLGRERSTAPGDLHLLFDARRGRAPPTSTPATPASCGTWSTGRTG